MSEKISLGSLAAGQPLERLLGAVGDGRFEAELVEHSGGELGDQHVVLDDQHPAERVDAVRPGSRCGHARRGSRGR